MRTWIFALMVSMIMISCNKLDGNNRDQYRATLTIYLKKNNEVQFGVKTQDSSIDYRTDGNSIIFYKGAFKDEFKVDVVSGSIEILSDGSGIESAVDIVVMQDNLELFHETVELSGLKSRTINY